MQDWTFTLGDAIGFTGVVILVGTYAALQAGRVDAKALSYSVLNAVAALLIGISLVFSFNAASMVIEIFWFVISVYGAVQALKRRPTQQKPD